MKRQIILLIILTCSVGQIFGQMAKSDCLMPGFVVGKAVHLPKPSIAVVQNCKCKTSGYLQKVNVQITINEDGGVEKAKAVSGHPLLRKLSEQAAGISRFSPTIFACEKRKTYATITYSYDLEKGFVTYNDPRPRLMKEPLRTEVVNRKAYYLPKPNVRFSPTRTQVVKVEIIVDEQGIVSETKAISGHPLSRPICEEAAQNTRFYPIWDVGKIKVKAFPVYKIRPDGRVEM